MTWYLRPKGVKDHMSTVFPPFFYGQCLQPFVCLQGTMEILWPELGMVPSGK